MLKGPATMAPSDISRAITTPPSSYGLTIQLNPRNATGRSTGASGFFARSSARSMPTSTALTSLSVQLPGSRPTGLMTNVVAWLSPRSQTSTLISIPLITLTQKQAFEIAGTDGRGRAHEVAAEIRRRLPFTCLHRRHPPEAAIERFATRGIDRHRDGGRHVAPSYDREERS